MLIPAIVAIVIVVPMTERASYLDSSSLTGIAGHRASVAKSVSPWFLLEPAQPTQGFARMSAPTLCSYRAGGRVGAARGGTNVWTGRRYAVQLVAAAW